jgi:hypothetical protein
MAMNRKCLTIVYMVLLPCVLGSNGSCQKPTTSELLQRGIYLQETVGDLDGAIRVYKQITQMARESRANGAQAEYRWGLCLQKKGRSAEAISVFQKLIKEYPEQTEFVAKARQFAESRQHVAPTSNPVGHFAFTPTGSMQVTRRNHQSVLLGNGTVLMVGGTSSTAAELYDPVARIFHATGAMESSRRFETATRLRDGKVLITGGGSCSKPPRCDLASAEIYDPRTAGFTPTGTMSVERTAHTATLLTDGKVLIAGGHNSNGAPAGAEIYDPLLSRFVPTGAMSAGRWFHTASVLPNGKVLIAGGRRVQGNGDYPPVAELYDPATGTFNATGSLVASRALHTATLLPDGKVLLTGGIKGDLCLASAELYDPATGRFTDTGPMSTPRVGHTATLLANGKVLVAGGQRSVRGTDLAGAYLATAELYDPSTGSFLPAGAMATPRADHSAVLLSDGKVLLSGGMVPPENYLSTAELYTFVQPVQPAQPLAVSGLGDLKLLPEPWKDGEVLEYTRKKKADSTGFKIWRLFHSAKTEAGHWLFEEHDAGLFDRIEFNPETMAPADLFEATASHSFHASYQEKSVQITEGDGKVLSPIVLDGPAFDARELPAILARLPWASNYKVALPLFWTSSGRVARYAFSVTGEEDIKVSAGEFHCYRVEEDDLTDRMFAIEKLWIATDATHMIVKSVRGDWSDELSASTGTDPEESVYRDEQTGASFKVPAGWMVEGPRRGEQMVNWYLTDLHSAAFVTLRVFPYESGDFTASQIQSEVEKQAAEKKDIAVRPASWHVRQVDRNVAVSWIEDLPQHRQVRYRAWMRTGAAGADIFADADPPSFDAMRPTFDAILESVALQ